MGDSVAVMVTGENSTAAGRARASFTAAPIAVTAASASKSEGHRGVARGGVDPAIEVPAEVGNIVVDGIEGACDGSAELGMNPIVTLGVAVKVATEGSGLGASRMARIASVRRIGTGAAPLPSVDELADDAEGGEDESAR